MSDALSKEGKELDKKYIIIPGRNIKRLGAYEATLRLHKDVAIKFPFEIIAESKKKSKKVIKQNCFCKQLFYLIALSIVKFAYLYLL